MNKSNESLHIIFQSKNSCNPSSYNLNSTTTTNQLQSETKHNHSLQLNICIAVSMKMKKKLMMKQEYHNHHFHDSNHTMYVSSHSSNMTMTESLCSSTGGSSDLPIMDTIHDDIELNDEIPPPPPLHELNCKNGAIPPALNVPTMPIISTKKPSGYCSQCTSYAIQLSGLTKELYSFKISLGETQMQLNNAMQETSH